MPAYVRIFLSKLKVTGIFPTFVNLKLFFLVEPTTTFPKSQAYDAIVMFSRLTVTPPIPKVAPP